MTRREHLIYGDSDEARLPDAANRNLLGKLYRHYDEAGLLTFDAYDFKGNLLEKVRQVIIDEAILAVFNPPRTGLLGRLLDLLGVPNPPPDWQVPAFRVTWQPPTDATPADLEETLLDPHEYRTSIRYDALNRLKTLQYPQDVEGRRKTLRPHHNRAGGLERVELDDMTYVTHIAYNAKGQRTLAALGNGVMTRYAYDPRTFRLARMRSERYTRPDSDARTFQPTGAPLQDMTYRYDLAGNILEIVERTPGCGVQDNPETALVTDPALALLVAQGDALVRRFSYDSLYRLTSARGRECKAIPRFPPSSDDPRCGFNSGNHGTPNQDNAPNLTAVYRQAYTYDAAGNILQMRHSAGPGSFTRRFSLVPGNNRLQSLVVGNGTDQPLSFVYDPNGNLLREGDSRRFEWDHSDQMKGFRIQAGVSEPSVHAQYLYDAGGMRVKKLVRKQGSRFESTIYIDGLFEHQRWQEGGGQAGENNHLHHWSQVKVH